MYMPMLIFDREAITIDLGPELLPSPRCVRQAPQTEHERRPLLPPLGPGAAQPHLHQCLARRLRHAAADRQPTPALHIYSGIASSWVSWWRPEGRFRHRTAHFVD